MSPRPTRKKKPEPFKMSDAEKSQRSYLAFKGKITAADDDASFLAWLKRLISVTDDCRTPNEKAWTERLQGV